MDIINPDLSHIDFLDLADSDIKCADALLKIKEYHNAVYHFQQSVEKSCKYLGLTIKAFTFGELRNINHEPQRVFDKIFYSDVFSYVNSNNDYNKIKQKFKSVSLNEKYDGVYHYIEKIFTNTISDNKLYSEQVIEYFDSNPFSNLYNEDFVENIRKYRDNPNIGAICKEFLHKFDSMQKCLLCQMVMSFLVSGIEANSRSIDEKGMTPKKVYSEESFIIKYLSYFIKKQEFCIKVLDDYFKPMK